MATRTGHVALAGAPNVGKSTLLNALVGNHLAIVSPKAQSTRLPVTGLRTEGDTQFIFHDLPGLLQPEYALHSRMQAAGQQMLSKVDVVVHLHPAPQAPAPEFWTVAGVPPLDVPVVTAYTKGDLGSSHLPAGALVLAAERGEGVDRLLAAIREHLPAAPFDFDPDDIGTQPLRFFATEYIREAAFQYLEDEVPYALAAEVEEFREHTRPVYIRVTLLVERDSQKGIVIGKEGRTLKAIGQHARARLEGLLGESVYLDLWVKVLPNWRRNESALDRLGFPHA